MPKNLYRFFDHFGLVTFAFLLGDAIVDLADGFDSWRVYVRILIGIGGLLVDGYLVFFCKE